MSISIDSVSKVSGIAIAVVAVVTFIISVMDNREERRDNRINSWRKVAIQKALQDAPNNELEIANILTEVRDSAWEISNLNLHKEELSEERIRELLLEMIASGIVDQNKNDMYNLRFALKTTSDADEFVARNMAEDFNKGNRFRIDLQDKLNMTPGHFSTEVIFEEVAKPLNIDPIQYQMLINMFEAIGVIEIDEDGNVRLKTKRIDGS